MISMKTMLAASAMAFGASLTAAAQQAKSKIDTLVVSCLPFFLTLLYFSLRSSADTSDKPAAPSNSSPGP